MSGLDFTSMKTTLESGQYFRFTETDGGLTVYSGDRVMSITEQQWDIVDDFWRDFWDLNRDYDAIEQTLSRDERLREAIKKGRGLRLLNQEPFECLISFIISQNNNIPRIKKIIDRLCTAFGEKKTGFFAFPTAERLALADTEQLMDCGVGFRARYIADAALQVASGTIDLPYIASLPTNEAREALMSIKGVGPKVGDCVLLYAFGRREVYPVDVWIKRLTEQLYFGGAERSSNDIRVFAESTFGRYAGYAQQYIFNLSR